MDPKKEMKKEKFHWFQKKIRKGQKSLTLSLVRPISPLRTIGSLCKRPENRKMKEKISSKPLEQMITSQDLARVNNLARKKVGLLLSRVSHQARKNTSLLLSRVSNQTRLPP